MKRPNTKATGSCKASQTKTIKLHMGQFQSDGAAITPPGIDTQKPQLFQISFESLAGVNNPGKSRDTFVLDGELLVATGGKPPLTVWAVAGVYRDLPPNLRCDRPDFDPADVTTDVDLLGLANRFAAALDTCADQVDGIREVYRGAGGPPRNRRDRCSTPPCWSPAWRSRRRLPAAGRMRC